MSRWLCSLLSLVLALALASPASAQALNVYTAWPESLSLPIFRA